MNNTFVTDSIKYIGVDDPDIDLFESQYVVPNGVSYNSYVIMDEKITYDGVMFSKDDKPIYYTDLLNRVFVRIEELLDKAGINE